jgi:type II secretory pathway pseudopilin PulG
MLLRNTRPEPDNAEDGYLLLTVLVMVFLLLLALSVAAPRVAKQIQRDKEEEAIQRGLQYKRAIRLYYKKFGAYPTDIKQLENTNQIRFLRKRYKDPITGQDDWRLIHMGEAKVPPLGFFGQPLQAGMSSVSTGPGGGGATPGLYAPDTPGVGSSENGSSGNSGNNGQNGSSSFGFNNNNNSNANTNTMSSPSSGSSGFGFSNSNNSSTTPSTGGVPGTPPGTSGPGAGTTGSSGTFGGGGPIVGVGIPVKKDSLIDYHKQKKYSDWEFVYDPQEELLMNGGGIINGGNINGTGTGSNPTGSPSGSPGTGSGTPFGFGNGNSGGNSGSSFGFGNSGSGPTTPTPPSNPNPQQ